MNIYLFVDLQREVRPAVLRHGRAEQQLLRRLVPERQGDLGQEEARKLQDQSFRPVQRLRCGHQEESRQERLLQS